VAIRVVVADDNLLVREGVRALLGEQSDMDVVGLAADLAELMMRSIKPAGRRRHRHQNAADPYRRRSTGGDRLTRTHPDLGVVVLSQYDDPAHSAALFADGVARRAYLLKERVAQPGQLADAVRAVAGGGSVIDPRVVESMLNSRSRRTTALAHLTTREREVLAEMATGASNTTIGERLFITVRAVERHINSIFAKLGLTEDGDVHRRVQAVLLYLSEA
jgi:DNA-binding NarL/FixJ family response regulator